MSNSHPPTQTDASTLLTDTIRRRICSILTDPDPPVSERDLAGELAARCLDTPANEITPDQRQQQLIQLHHHQLPKLADYGLVTYDQSMRTVSITDAGREALAAVSDGQQNPRAAVTVTN
ncbi:hypothetical protein halTADL_0861 [Halohasta litchfieldiae]|jgi:hypothetical protein|uniref:DUF7344 domain-containing protein n=1 Tax=Halohasta litchfieldiae TaxID=1073996 RepID=A0A1H6T8U3_9EURY|nr:hypothetical protein [Halohasta litchfieldiae]ATW87657.1 hypothetical protein halTADL_0861 [Halohasta litchfieldiae]SEI76479.1 hypothetical protein SAMN05444271_107121 [Halohasta litchfieldiae]